MVSITSDDEAIAEAEAELIAAGSDEERKEKAEELLEAVSESSPPVQEEATELIASNTSYNKSTVTDWLEEVKTDVSLDAIDVQRVEKIIPEDGSEDVKMKFDINIGGQRASLQFSSDDLMSSRNFEKRVFEVTNQKISIPNWDDALNVWMDRAEVVERGEDPISVEHSVAERVLDELSIIKVTHDYDQFRANPENNVYYDDDAGTILISSRLIEQLANQAKRDVTMRKLRDVLKPYLSGNSKPVRSDEGMFRVWQFDPHALADENVIDLDEINPDEDQD